MVSPYRRTASVPTSTLIPVPVTGIQQRRVCGAGRVFQPKDLVWLDSCDKHRNEEGSVAISSRTHQTRSSRSRP
ncbi:hypothetical protein CN102_14065 [Sinorhizobium meliloti]|nr:hypothetical protein SMRU11_37655 [Sinorhizobium meliloti RU11/001]RVO07283.1 hypothetical protein CN102_14065 [Sinorhizobium meliloti]